MQAPNQQIQDLQTLKCSVCGSEVFNEAFFLKELPAVLSTDGKPGLMPIQVFACIKCGNVEDKYNPLKVNTPKSVLVN